MPARTKITSNYLAWQLTPLDQQDFQKLDTHKQLKYLASCGHLAPSSHNTQPWKFQILPKEKLIQVYLNLGKYFIENGKTVDQRRVLPVSDKTGRQGCISLGCAIANIETAAAALGLCVSTLIRDLGTKEVQPLQKPQFTHEHIIAAAEIQISNKHQKKDQKLFKAIFARRVNRSEYLSKSIPKTVMSDLRKVKSAGINIELIENNLSNSAKFMLLSNSQFQADKTVFNDNQFIFELGKWVLKNGSRSGLGMPFETFGVRNNLEALKLYLSFQVKRAFSIKEKAGFAQAAMKGIESAPVAGIISVREDKPKAWIEAGRCLENIALIAETASLAMSIHAGIAEVPGIKQSLTWIDHKRSTVVIIFRIGFSDISLPHSPRLDPEGIIF